MAAAAWGSTNVTVDCDIAFATDGDNIEVLAKALRQQNGRPVRGGGPDAVDPKLIAASPFLHLDSDVGLSDLIGRLPGVGAFDILHANAEERIIGSTVVRVAALDHIIAMKEAAGRVRDLLHLTELKAIRDDLNQDG
jgi:hypothetical protein